MIPRYLILDNYCKNHLCNCQDIILDFYRIDQDEEGKNTTVSIGQYFYNYRTHKKRIDSPNEETVSALFESLFEEYENLDKIFHRRNMVIRELYGKWRHQYRLKKELVLSKPKVGRNEPCPCGSGKKFKRCCMNKMKK